VSHSGLGLARWPQTGCLVVSRPQPSPTGWVGCPAGSCWARPRAWSSTVCTNLGSEPASVSTVCRARANALAGDPGPSVEPELLARGAHMVEAFDALCWASRHCRGVRAVPSSAPAAVNRSAASANPGGADVSGAGGGAVEHE